MEIINLHGSLPWKSSIGRRRLDEIKYVIVHHDASLAGDVYDAKKLYAREAEYHIAKGWGHLGYSFRIARNGKVYQTVSYDEIGAHAGNRDFYKNSIGVCLDGSFDKQKPSKAQVNTLKELMDYLSYHSPELPGVTKKSWYAHREVRGAGFPGTKFFIPNGTFCPGPEITEIVQSYRKN